MSWRNDTLHLPPVDISTLPVTSPTCGWMNLDASANKVVEVSGTVGGYFWSVFDSSCQMRGDYIGVSW